MDYILGLIINLVLEEGINASNSKKISKPLRYILLVLIILLYIMILGVIIISGIIILKQNLTEGILILLFGLCFSIISIVRFRVVYRKKSK